MNNIPIVTVKNLHKHFNLPHEKYSGIKQRLLNFWRPNTHERQQVLKNVSFDIERGDFFGIVGRNGSGKSTLLKLLAGIYTPNSGSVEVRGKLTPFIELGVGFNPELTGRENVYLNGALLGFSRKDIDEIYEDIVAFAELERFMDQKLKNYSSGMQVRLAFSIAIRAKSDILLIDEVLAVGDYEFQQKCFEYFKHLKKNKQTVILVSHDQASVQQYCDKAIYIEKGQIIAAGPTRQVLEEYNRENDRRAEELAQKEETKRERKVTGIGAATIDSVYTLAGNKHKKHVFNPYDTLQVVFEMTAKQVLETPVVGMIIFDRTGQTLVATNSLDRDMTIDTIPEGTRFKVIYEFENTFEDGEYGISGAIANADRSVVYGRVENAATFRSQGWNATAKGLMYPKHTINIQSD